MSVYLIAEINVINKDLYNEYSEKAHSILKKYEGKYIVKGGKVTPLSGNWNPERFIIVQFPTKEHMEKCFSSEEYLEIAPLRKNSTTSKSMIIEGI